MNDGKLQLDADDVHVDRVHDHAREFFHPVFNALLERLGDRVDGYAELDNHIYVDVDAVAVGGDFYAPALRLALEEFGEAVGKTARNGFDDAVTFHRRLRSDLRDHHIGNCDFAVGIARIY